jgi:hypothetical protein
MNERRKNNILFVSSVSLFRLERNITIFIRKSLILTSSQERGNGGGGHGMNEHWINVVWSTKLNGAPLDDGQMGYTQTVVSKSIST